CAVELRSPGISRFRRKIAKRSIKTLEHKRENAKE
nr:Chain A, PROTEIN (COLLAGEN ALPHA 1) [synthetic construct]1B9Q_A Chain A, PROTEIN (COLLAGEN ALPHA 1) [synthetic construct]